MSKKKQNKDKHHPNKEFCHNLNKTFDWYCMWFGQGCPNFYSCNKQIVLVDLSEESNMYLIVFVLFQPPESSSLPLKLQGTEKVTTTLCTTPVWMQNSRRKSRVNIHNTLQWPCFHILVLVYFDNLTLLLSTWFISHNRKNTILRHTWRETETKPLSTSI